MYVKLEPLRSFKVDKLLSQSYHCNNSMDSSTANDANIPVEDSRSCANYTAICHTWTIRNFKFCELKVGEFLQSVTFRSRVGEDTTEWCIRLYPKGHSEETKECLVLMVLPTKKTELKAWYAVSIVHPEGGRARLERLPSSNTFGIDRPIKFAALVKHDVLNNTRGMMQGDNLVLFCEIITDISKTLEHLNVIKYTEPKSYLLAKIGQLFETKKFSDVTITVGETKFQAHKNILAAQSPKLSEMLEHDAEETKQTNKQSCICGVEGGKRPEPYQEELPIKRKKTEQGSIDMTGIGDEVVKKMLHFLYTGTVNNINENTVDLLVAAKEYELQELKLMCEETLRASLTVENAVNTLIMADRHNADQLKSRAISFICSHAKDVVTTTGFQAMITAQPSLVTEVFCRLAQQKYSQSHYASETDASASKSNASTSNTC